MCVVAPQVQQKLSPSPFKVKCSDWPVLLTPSPRSHPAITVAISPEELNIIDVVHLSHWADMERLEQELSEEKQGAGRLHAECRQLWIRISKLMVVLEENNIEIPISANA